MTERPPSRLRRRPPKGASPAWGGPARAERVAFDAGAAAGIARITLSNPARLNALSLAMWRELRGHFEALQAQPGSARVVIVAGADGNFAAGGDIEEFSDFRFDHETLARYHEHEVLPALQAMLACDLPLVAQIDGAPHYDYADSAEHREGLAAFNDKRAPRF